VADGPEDERADQGATAHRPDQQPEGDGATELALRVDRQEHRGVRGIEEVGDDHQQHQGAQQRLANGEAQTLGELAPVPARRDRRSIFLSFAPQPAAPVQAARDQLGDDRRGDEEGACVGDQHSERAECCNEKSRQRCPEQPCGALGGLERPHRSLEGDPCGDRHVGEERGASGLARGVEQAAEEHQRQERPERQADGAVQQGDRRDGDCTDQISRHARAAIAEAVDEDSAQGTADHHGQRGESAGQASLRR